MMCGSKEMWREFIFLNILHFGVSQRPQQQWYLTGKNFNDHRNRTKYASEVINLWSLSQDHSRHELEKNEETPEEKTMNYTHSSFGGAIAVYAGHNTTVDIAIEKLLHEVLRPHFQTSLRKEKETGSEPVATTPTPYQLDIVDVWQYDILVSVNQDDPLQYEIGLYDLPSATWLKYGIHDVKLGKEWRIICNISRFDTDSHRYEVHRFVVTSDLYQTLTMTQHTWEAISTIDRESSPLLENSDPQQQSVDPIQLRVMTYNIWHNNPPAWLLHDNKKRWKWYQKRMRHLAKMIHTQSPDVITLQEVRLDNTFPPKTKTIEQLGQYGYEYHSKDDSEALKSALFMDPTGSQLHHVLRYLHQSYLALQEENSEQHANQTEECTLSPDGGECIPLAIPLKDRHILDNIFDKYQFVYQPAMSMYEREQMGKRIEEGIAILIKTDIGSTRQSDGRNSRHSMHVSKIQTLFLPRNFEDPSDDHHRAVLHVELQLQSLRPLHSSNFAPSPVTVDVMTTHMSLSSVARDESVKAIWNYTLHECQGDIQVDSTSPLFLIFLLVQILTGDFNAEPHEPSYGCLTGRCEHSTTHEPGNSALLDWSQLFGEADCPCDSRQRPFLDSWLSSANELRAYRSGKYENGKSKLSEVEREGYTYPPCNPEKRIDFILVRNQTVPATGTQAWVSRIKSSWLAGKEVTDDTGNLILNQNRDPITVHLLQSNDEKGVGMLDQNSPIWASDHYAVVTDLEFLYTADATP